MIAPGSLEGITVLDLSRLLPGGFCSLLFADAGADVIKVEDTGMGDYIRWAPPLYGDDSKQALGTRSSLYLSLNRGKRSIRLDLKSDSGREALLRLARDADVVLESFRPGVLDRLGVGYEALKADVARRGVAIPLELDQNGTLLDGHARLRAARALGLPDDEIPVVQASVAKAEVYNLTS